MKATNYHNETVNFDVDQPVTHVNEEGEIVKGTVKALVAPNALEIAFKDGEEGTEMASTCF